MSDLVERLRYRQVEVEGLHTLVSPELLSEIIAALDAQPVGLDATDKPRVMMSSRTPRQVLVLLPAIGKDGRCSACGAVPSRETGNCRCPVKIDAALASEPQPPDDEWVKEQLRRHPKRPPVGLASEPQP